MPSGLLPRTTNDALATPSDPQEVVEAFLAALAESDTAAAAALLDEDVRYVNVGLPALRGRTQAMRFLGGLDRPGTGFEVYLHAITAEAGVVLTERTDVITVGPFRAQFWVAGRFDVRDGRITLWRDAFDMVDILRATVRGLVGIVVPALRPKAPQSVDTPPGRHQR